MRRILAVLVLGAVLAGCGPVAGQPAGGGGGGGGASGGAPVANGAVPPGSSVYFGSAYDPATYAVADRSTKAKVGAPIVAVGKALAPVDGSQIKLQLTLNGQSKPLRPPDAMDNPTSTSFFASDLTKDNLTPGTWIVSFINASNRVIASGFLSVAP
jgi:hypothetical protein